MLPACSAPATEALNRECFCESLDPDALAREIDRELGELGGQRDRSGAGPGQERLADWVRTRCPHVFAPQPVFVAPSQLARIREIAAAVDTIVALPGYRDAALRESPDVARQTGGGDQPGPRGVFLGFDFHLDDGMPQLIEINTNAGGAMLNAVLARAQRACCPAMAGLVPTATSVDAFERAIVAMFHEEWRLAGGHRPLRSVAIVDEDPQAQYLYPEFLLFQRLFERHGIRARITDPAALAVRDGRLWIPAQGEDAGADFPVDLVYNRLTDFYLDDPRNAAVRTAFETACAAVTPNPRNYALHADKRRLVWLSDPLRLSELGVPPALGRLLAAHVPRTEPVGADNAERLWTERRHWFFKPVTGYGARAAYRGDKLTRRVWDEIRAGRYIAQRFAAPAERVVAEGEAALKFDLRAYAYHGTTQWVAARVYQGQTTNFRTPGGGFAAVYSTTTGGTGA